MADEAFRHKFSSTLENEWEISLLLVLSLLFSVFFLSSPLSLSLSPFQSLFLSPFLFRFFPSDTCRQAHTSREPTSEKCNLSISAPQRKDKQCWKNEGDKHAAELMLDKHVAFPPIHKWPCHVHALTGVEIQGQTWLRPWFAVVVSGVCLLVVLVSVLLFDRFAPRRMRPFKTTEEGWLLF